MDLLRYPVGTPAWQGQHSQRSVCLVTSALRGCLRPWIPSSPTRHHCQRILGLIPSADIPRRYCTSRPHKASHSNVTYAHHGNSLHVRNKAVVLSHHSCVHWRNTSDFLHELSLCIHTLANWHTRSWFWPLSTFDMPASLNLITPSFFDLKWGMCDSSFI